MAALLAACGDADQAPSAPPGTTASPTTTVSPSPTTTVPVLAADQSGCSGLAVRPAEPALTWQSGNELRSARGCIVRFATDAFVPLGPVWSPAGDALLVDMTLTSYVVSAAGQQPLPAPSSWTWLGRNGALLWVHDGVLTRRNADGSLSGTGFRGHVQSVAASPDGTYVVGDATLDGLEGLYRIDVGDGSARLLRPGEVDELENIELTAAGDVVFVEEDGDVLRLHRFDVDTGATTLLTTGRRQSGLWAVASPHDDTAIAWLATTECSEQPVAGGTRNGKPLALAGTPVERATPQAWLPDGTIVFNDAPLGCEPSPGTLWAFRNGRATKVADEVLDVAIRPAGTAPSAAGG